MVVGRASFDPKRPQAFLSYTRTDENFFRNGINWLKSDLEEMVAVRIGNPFQIFLDIDDIVTGDNWEKKLNMAVESAQLFIPILTPSFFNSDFCRHEAEIFLRHEANKNRDDLILPIYLIEADILENPKLRERDTLAKRLHSRKYDDWRKLNQKFRDPDTRVKDPDINDKIDKLGHTLATAAKRGVVAEPPNSFELDEADSYDYTSARTSSRNETLWKRLTSLAIFAAALVLGALGGWIGKSDKDNYDIAQRHKLIDALKSELEAQRQLTLKLLETLEAQASEPAITRGTELQELIEESKSEFEVRVLRASELEKMLEAIKGPIPDNTEKMRFNQIEPAAGRQQKVEWKGFADAGQSLKDCAQCPEMVVLPPGSFVMGSPNSEDGRGDDEGPQREVTISYPFALGKYEITHAQFGHFVSEESYEATGCRYWDGNAWLDDPNRDWRYPGYEQTDDHPVACVSWEDSQAYVGWLSNKTNQDYRLPSEAEWEYAARAGSTTPYFWGLENDSPCDYANGLDAIGKQINGFDRFAFSCDDKHSQTAPVGSFRANVFGLHDMAGNVWEWVGDSWHKNYEGAPINGNAWTEGGSFWRVNRGGSWAFNPWNLRSANRRAFEPDERNFGIGFRVAKKVRQEQQD